MTDVADADPASPRSLCPICRRPTDPPIRPFCSKRCADIDLHRWLTGGYAVPAEQVADENGSSDADAANEKP